MVISMERWVGKVAVVTGASAGIGAAVVEQLVERGVKVAGFARRKELLEQLAAKLEGKKGKLYPVKVDATKEDDILSGFKWVKENLGTVHILINNAAYTENTTVADGDAEIWKRTFQLNVIGLSVATREAVSDMRANDVDGHIIHINSIVGHNVYNIPGSNVYPASKFAVTALAETLRLELNSLKSKIKITSLSPGVVNTDFISVRPYSKTEAFKKAIEAKHVLEPADVADAVTYVLSTPPHVQIQELTIRAVIDPV